jgi:hypothetical protein
MSAVLLNFASLINSMLFSLPILDNDGAYDWRNLSHSITSINTVLM